MNVLSLESIHKLGQHMYVLLNHVSQKTDK